MTRPIGITMGDPAGVGPEIIVKSLASMTPEDRRAYRIFGNAGSLGAAERVLKTGIDLATLDIHQTDIPGETMPFGKLDERGGEACFRFIEAAVRQAERGEIAGIVTAPINKAALNAAGHHYDGHTGMLASLTGSKSSFMLLTSERLNVIHVSTHISLKGAIDRARTDRILATIRAGHQQFLRLGITPRIAVAGLNPHCGEGGLFGDEDDTQIAPAVDAARAEGIDAHGPISADTVFHRAYEGAFDLIVAQYHDQGHIPIKLVAFDTAVNVSLGLPIDRCSVDHGTAFDIAGQGIANNTNLNHALAYARRMAATSEAQMIRGVYCASATPLNADLSPDLGALAAHARTLIADGCDGLALLGTTGEANSFSLSERRAILEAAAQAVGPERLMPGTGVNALPETVELTRHALSLGVTRVVMLPPSYYKGVSDEGLFRAYAQVIEAIGDTRLRVLLYHIPQVSGVPISHDLIERLVAAFPGTVVGIKDSAGKIENMTAMIDRFPGFSVLAGADPLLLPLMGQGGAGCITATSNLVADSLATVFRHHADPVRKAEVEAAQARINAFRDLSNSYTQIPAIKAMVGFRHGSAIWTRTRPPLVGLAPAELDDLKTRLRAIGASVKDLAA